MDKPEALLQRLERLGQDSVGNYGMPVCAEAAAELRRLHALNAELLEALKIARPYVSAALTNTGSADAYHAERQVDIAIARAEGEKT